jgi:hypothetical protein
MWTAVHLASYACILVGIVWLVAQRRGATLEARPRRPSDSPDAALPLGRIEPTTALILRHPVQGDTSVLVEGRIVYDELIQRVRGPQSPWVPTGNAYCGLRLASGWFLLQWQNRIYLLDECREVSDVDIGRDFASPARAFGQADQKAEVTLEYPSSTIWRIEDIGKLSVREVSGRSPSVVVGATGRFIHAAGEAGRALVVEDFQFGGKDRVWTGYRIQESDMRAV